MGCQVTTVRRGRCLEQTVQVLFIPAWDLGLVVRYVIRHESNDELASRILRRCSVQDVYLDRLQLVTSYKLWRKTTTSFRM